VSVERKDFGELPPYPSEDYSYTSDTNPPVLKTALRHFIEHPSHAPKYPHHRPRIPKKVGEPLLLDKSLGALDAHEGYGLYIQERICWRKVFAIEAIFATLCGEHVVQSLAKLASPLCAPAAIFERRI
jgi:hypothetical protein